MNASHLSDSVKSFFVPGQQRRRLLMAIIGVLVCGVSVAFFKQAAFGTDPFQCLCNGLDNVIPISFGTLYMLINLVLLVVVFLMDRHYIGIATFINLFLLGYLVEFSEYAIHSVFGDPSMALRIVYLIIGIVVMCVSSALYFTANLGVSTYDSIALHLDKKLPIPFKFIRICTDLICVAVGFLFRYMPGVGTIITAFFMGPLISLFNRTIAEPLLYGKGGKPEAH
ncbi:MAG: YitT family protein [Clostridia bacterium]|nr:YitT family protein [Clostridia bacterium]